MKIVKIGRSSSNDVIIDDSSVSRMHCQIIHDDNGNYTIIDTNSTNGTIVNGIVRRGEVSLNINDTVRIGNTNLPWQSYFGERDNNANNNLSGNLINIVNVNNQQAGPRPNDYLVWAVLSTLFCCLPFGLCSIVHAARVNSYWDSGNYNAANESARKAKVWFWWSVAPGLIIYIVTIILYTTIGIAAFGL